jgi:hypothetical protein
LEKNDKKLEEEVKSPAGRRQLARGEATSLFLRCNLAQGRDDIGLNGTVAGAGTIRVCNEHHIDGGLQNMMVMPNGFTQPTLYAISSHGVSHLFTDCGAKACSFSIALSIENE